MGAHSGYLHKPPAVRRFAEDRFSLRRLGQLLVFGRLKMSRFVALPVLLILLIGCASPTESEDPRTPLERAARLGDLAEVKRLLASGADPNDRGGLSGPLTAAARDGNVEVLRVLLYAGANPDGRAAEEETCWASPLRFATSTGGVEATRTLLDAGASMETRCWKPIAGHLNAPIVDLLVERGLDLKAVDENGRNHLHLALAPPSVPRIEGIDYLVRAGVPLNARDLSGKTPLAYWREPRDYETQEFRMWLIAKFFGEADDIRRSREDRARISVLLERAGASL